MGGETRSSPVRERDPLSSRSVMKNMRAQLEKLRRRAWEFALIGRKADTDDKRELLALLNTHFTALADHVERSG